MKIPSNIVLVFSTPSLSLALYCRTSVTLSFTGPLGSYTLRPAQLSNIKQTDPAIK